MKAANCFVHFALTSAALFGATNCLADSFSVIAGKTYFLDTTIQAKETIDNSSVVYCQYSKRTVQNIVFGSAGDTARFYYAIADPSREDRRFDEATVKDYMWSASDQRDLDRAINSNSNNSIATGNALIAEKKAAPANTKSWRDKCYGELHAFQSFATATITKVAWGNSATNAVNLSGEFTVLETNGSKGETPVRWEAGNSFRINLELLENGAYIKASRYANDAPELILKVAPR